MPETFDEMIDLTKHQKKVDGLMAQYCLAAEQEKKENESLANAKDETVSTEEAQQIVQQIAQTLQQQAHTRIAGVVSRCLNVVFDDAYEFEIRFEKKRGRTEARLVFMRDGMVMDDPLNEIGGGVIDVAALALRLAAIRLSRPQLRHLVVLDEPLKNVRGKSYKKRVRQMLLTLAEEMGFQFVLSIDADAYPEFISGKIVEVS